MPCRLLLVACLALTASLAFAVPSLVSPLTEGVYEVHDDAGSWGGMTNGITHMNRGEYQAKKVLDTSAVPEAVWGSVVQVRLAVYFMVRDYSSHTLPAPNGLDESYQIVVNGKVHEFPTSGGAPVFLDNKPPSIGWFDIALPREEFLHGANEIVVRKSPDSKGDDYLYLGIDNTQKRGNSSVTFDSKTWTQDRLTIPGGNGEYMIRLYLLTKPTQCEVRWQPGAALTDPDGLIVYAGARGTRATTDGLKLAPGQVARVEWRTEALDQLEPLAASITGSGALTMQWMTADGSAAKGTTPTTGAQMDLPAGRSLQPAGLLITAGGGPATLQSVTLRGSRSYHPQPQPINLTPAMKSVTVPTALTPACQVDEKEVTLSGGYLRATFQRGEHLRLASLYNTITKTEMVRDASASALFLVEVGDKRYSGSRDFRLTSLTATGSGFSAQMDLTDGAATLRGLLEAAIEASGLRLSFRLTNVGPQSVDFKLAFPHLAGLAVSPAAKDDYYFYPWGGGIIADTPAAIRRGYGDHEALYQVMDLYSPQLGGGLSVRTDDAEGWHKVLALRKHLAGETEVAQEILSMRVKPEYQWKPGPLEAVEGTSFAYEYLRRTRAAGGSFSPAPAVLSAHAGDWHAAMADYARWAHSVWTFRPYPSRLKSIHNMIAAGWGTSFLFKDGKYRTDFVQPNTDCTELMSWWDWSPLGPFGTPFEELDKVLTPAQIKQWSGYFVTDPVTGKKMWNDQPGDYDGYNERFGGLPAFQQAVKTYQGMGALTTLYTDPFRVDFTSKTGLAHGRDWGVIDDKDKLSTAYEVYNPCHDLPEVRQWVATTMGRVMRETGADGIRLDEYGHRGWACYSPDHKHTFAEPGITQWQKAVAEATKMVHAEMDKVKPGLVLTTEHPGYDYLMQYLEGCITYDLTVLKSPLRPLECNLQRFYFPECKAYELDHQGADPLSRKKFWNAVESFGRYFPANMHTTLKENEEVYQGRDSYPLLPTLQPYLYCNRFAGAGKTLYHLYNALGHTFEGSALALAVDADRHVVELLRCEELLVVEGRVSVYLERGDVACVAVLPRLIQATKEGDRLQVTLIKVQVGDRLVLADATGKELLAQDARSGLQTLDLTQAEKPACVKLLRAGQLLDVVQAPK